MSDTAYDTTDLNLLYTILPSVQDGVAQLGRVQEGRRQATDLVRHHLDVLTVQTRQDGTRLVADADHLDVRVLGKLTADVTGDAGVHRTAQTTVGRDGNVQLLGVLLLRRDFRLLVELLGTDAVRSRLLQIALSTRIPAGGVECNGWCMVEPAGPTACIWHDTYLAADTIFMDWVIFWMFLTDFNRIEMAFSVAIPRFCWPRHSSAGTCDSTGTTDLNMVPASETERGRCMTVAQLEKDFRSLEGHSIPYQDYGFQSLDAMLRTMSSCVQVNQRLRAGSLSSANNHREEPAHTDDDREK
uniref:HTH OST-type domain-containing protein n=1 Tax=Anopheles dirus TaxID=7168 RepID=A0A182NTJ5_9DIPT